MLDSKLCPMRPRLASAVHTSGPCVSGTGTVVCCQIFACQWQYPPFPVHGVYYYRLTVLPLPQPWDHSELTLGPNRHIPRAIKTFGKQKINSGSVQKNVKCAVACGIYDVQLNHRKGRLPVHSTSYHTFNKLPRLNSMRQGGH